MQEKEIAAEGWMEEKKDMTMGQKSEKRKNETDPAEKIIRALIRQYGDQYGVSVINWKKGEEDLQKEKPQKENMLKDVDPKEKE